MEKVLRELLKLKATEQLSLTIEVKLPLEDTPTIIVVMGNSRVSVTQVGKDGMELIKAIENAVIKHENITTTDFIENTMGELGSI